MICDNVFNEKKEWIGHTEEVHGKQEKGNCMKIRDWEFVKPCSEQLIIIRFTKSGSVHNIGLRILDIASRINDIFVQLHIHLIFIVFPPNLLIYLLQRIHYHISMDFLFVLKF